MRHLRPSLFLALPLFTLVACGGSGATLVDLDVLAAGEDCANGGVLVSTGVDANGDGVLQDDEVATSEPVCDGASASSALLTTTPLEVGDPTCADGGSKIEAGLDDGDPGGTANDGVLQPEEVDSTEFLCNPPGSSSGSTFVPFEPPEGPAAQYTVVSKGGTGTNATGGDGGDFELEMSYGSIGGGIRLYATGQADASWTYPASVSFFLGEVPLVISSDTTIPVVDGIEEVSVGDAYMNLFDNRIYLRTSAGADVVTGVSVAAGATLTFEVNYPNEVEVLNLGLPFNPPAGEVRVSLDNDVHLAGTLTTTGPGANRPGLAIYTDVFVGEATGSVDLTGDDQPGALGGQGGSFEVYAEDNDVDDITENNGAIFNQASINTSGGSGIEGGSAGSIELEPNWHLYNTGTLTANGGNGTNGDGGDGGDIDLDNDYAHNLNSGAISMRGGNAVDGSAGNGGDLYIYNGYYGHVYNTANIVADGGQATQCTFACSAGDGGDIEWYVYANDIISSGNISARGGNATLASGTTVEGGPYGGDGGDVDSQSDYEGGYHNADVVPVGDMIFSGNWNLSGGNGGRGGNGGTVSMDLDAEYGPDNQVIMFLGYQGVDLSGGDGTSGGGDAGGAYANPEYSYSDAMHYYGSGGPVINHVPFRLDGGDASDGSGGTGGYFELYTEYDYGFNAPWEQALNYGDISAKGGNGSLSGGEGGAFYLYGYRGVENHGDIVTDGGVGAGNGYTGGDAADNYDEWDNGIFLVSDWGNVLNTGNLSSRGGNATGPNGYAGEGSIVEIVGMQVTNSGSIVATGGNAPGTLGFAGDSGNIVMLSMYDDTIQTSTTLTVGPGTGDSEGNEGFIIIDGQNRTNDF